MKCLAYSLPQRKEDVNANFVSLSLSLKRNHKPSQNRSKFPTVREDYALIQTGK